MASKQDKQLSRRERQIMDILYEQKECSAHVILDKMPDAPSYSAVRALLAKMLEKGYVENRQEGAKYIYFPAHEISSARDSALQRLVKTFFGGSAVNAVSALVGMQSDQLSETELEELEALIAKARKNNKS